MKFFHCLREKGNGDAKRKVCLVAFLDSLVLFFYTCFKCCSSFYLWCPLITHRTNAHLFLSQNKLILSRTHKGKKRNNTIASFFATPLIELWVVTHKLRGVSLLDSDASPRFIAARSLISLFPAAAHRGIPQQRHALRLYGSF